MAGAWGGSSEGGLLGGDLNGEAKVWEKGVLGSRTAGAGASDGFALGPANEAEGENGSRVGEAGQARSHKALIRHLEDTLPAPRGLPCAPSQSCATSWW